jgi:hypothetical protein
LVLDTFPDAAAQMNFLMKTASDIPTPADVFDALTSRR